MVEDKSNIVNQAIIHPTARIASDAVISPWAVIGADVEIGSGTWIGPHTIIKGPTKIGANNKIYQFASIGEDPQVVEDIGSKSELIIGNNNTIREYVTINRGMERGGGTTRVGNGNLIMAYAHIAHDCKIGNENILVNNASLAGHVTVRNYAIIGVFVGVHQFCTIGSYSFLAHAAMITKDVLPYLMVADNVPSVHGLNTIGLRRRGFSAETIRKLRKAYSIIFRENLTIAQAVLRLEKMLKRCPEVQLFIDGLKNSARGIVR